MNPLEATNAESDAGEDFARIMEAGVASRSGGPAAQLAPARRVNLDPDKVKNGLAQLVLTLVKLLHELLERQALRRMDAGTLSDQEIERLGLALMRQAQEIERLREQFGLTEEELNLDLGPLGKLQ